MTTRSLSAISTSAATLVLLSACAGPTPQMAGPMVPMAVQVPAGHTVALQTVGTGTITYECREKADSMGQFEWVFAGPAATLADRQGRVLGRYFGPPATWAASDGSSVTGAQVAVAPAGAGDIPLQLVKANPATGQGLMTGTSYVQRLATVGGVAPAKPCDAGAKGRREVVQYKADYIFWKPA